MNEVISRALTLDQFRLLVRERLQGLGGASAGPSDFTQDDARLIVARLLAFETWERLVESLAQPPGNPRALTHGMSSTPPYYKIDRKENTLEPLLPLTDQDWDAILGIMEDLQITGLRAGGQMTDAVMARLPRLKHVTRLHLGGCKRLTDDGIAHLAGMPQLEELELSEYRGRQLTDRGLAVLRHLPALRRLELCWQSAITDTGLAHLAHCDRLESVDLMGTPSGDGSIAALAGKHHLRRLKTGRLLTDVGLARLHDLPMFKTWQGGDIRYSLMSPDAEPNHLVVDGPITDAGLAGLVGLDGLFALSVFWHAPRVTAAGLCALAELPHLGFLGCEGSLCDDQAMSHIAAIPRLRMLMAQGTVASDAGFAALSRSQTLEYLWGRECPNLTGRGFAALAGIGSLRGLAVSCKRVDDSALSALPRFPALRELMSMDIPDDGFRHVGRALELEHLWCMYCRDTTDAATEHLSALPRLRSYYAGKTRITDRSLQVLGRMTSLEAIELWECAGITDAGLAHLAGMPKLREISVGGSPRVTRAGLAVFPAQVRVSHGS